VASLERLEKFRGATGGDTLQHQAESRFMLAEQYLFQLDKPERALEEYRRIEHEFPGTQHQAKAILAQGWVLSRRLARPAEADSLFWSVVRQHPGTESQLAARDYLELAGASVPADLIRLPEPPVARAGTTPAVSSPPEGTPALGGWPASGPGDSLRLGPHARPGSPAIAGPGIGPGPAPGFGPPSGAGPREGAVPAGGVAAGGPPRPGATPPREGAPAATRQPARRDSTAVPSPPPSPPADPDETPPDSTDTR
jgi:hypothetical protein